MAPPVPTAAAALFVIIVIQSMHGLECSRSMAAMDAAAPQLRAKFVAPSGPNPGGNAAILGSKKDVLSIRLDAPSSPSSGPNGVAIHGAGMEIVEKMDPAKMTIDPESKVAKMVELSSKMPKGETTPNPGPSKDHNVVSMSGKLPRGSTPGSGPSPGHNGVSRFIQVPAKVACGDGLDSATFKVDIFSHN